MAGLWLFMIWCSLRFNDAIRTDPHMWQVDGEVIMGACKSKTKSMKKWIIANYALGEKAWLFPWHRKILWLEPSDKDFLIANLSRAKGTHTRLVHLTAST